MPDGTIAMSRLAMLALAIVLASLLLFVVAFSMAVNTPECTCGAVIVISLVLLLVGTVMGIVISNHIRASGARTRGRTIANLASVIGILSILGIFLFPIVVPHGQPSNMAVCANNLKQLGTAVEMYHADNDERYPPAVRWNYALMPYIDRRGVPAGRGLLQCPSATEETGPSYAMNHLLSGVSSAAVKSPAYTVLLFESVPRVNLAGAKDLLPSQPRHNGCDVVCFANGYVQPLAREKAGKLNWDPDKVVEDRGK